MLLQFLFGFLRLSLCQYPFTVLLPFPSLLAVRMETQTPTSFTSPSPQPFPVQLPPQAGFLFTFSFRPPFSPCSSGVIRVSMPSSSTSPTNDACFSPASLGYVSRGRGAEVGTRNCGSKVNTWRGNRDTERSLQTHSLINVKTWPKGRSEHLGTCELLINVQAQGHTL